MMGTMTLWHGGNLDGSKGLQHKGGRWEYGPGLYLITNYSIAQKYAKGSRKLYQVTISEGTDITRVSIPDEKVEDFLSSYCIKSKLKAVNELVSKFSKGGRTAAENLLVILINEGAIKNVDAPALRSFLVENGVDYWVVSNAFGFSDSAMVVLFNMDKIVKIDRMSGKHIETFDLPPEFSAKAAAADDFPPGFIEWLTSFVEGTDYNYKGDARGYKPEYAKFLQPFRPKGPATVYRGLTWGSGRGIEEWFSESLGLSGVPEVGQMVIHDRSRPTSWSKDFSKAKDFAHGGGIVLELKATPDMMLMDMEIMKESMCSDGDDVWRGMCEYTTEKEQEITLLPGRYEARSACCSGEPTGSRAVRFVAFFQSM